MTTLACVIRGPLTDFERTRDRHDEDKDLRQDGIPMTLGEGLSNEPGGHDREHTVPLRAAVDSIML